jgi:hypothetical protein
MATRNWLSEVFEGADKISGEILRETSLLQLVLRVHSDAIDAAK